MKKEKKKILTVAIPAYNVGDFLSQAVLSIVNSAFRDSIEILIINDGSKDNTKEVGQKLESDYPGVVYLINKTNGGHGSAINAGIKNAHGKYFRLLDGDDWFDTKCFDELMERLINENTDLILNDCVEVFTKTNRTNTTNYYKDLKPYQSYELADVDFYSWGPMLPNSTIKTTLLKKVGLEIDEKCYYVDQEYNLACYFAAKSVVYYPLSVYQYRLEQENQSMNKNSLIRNVFSHEKVCLRLIDEFEKRKKTLSENQKDYICNRVIIPIARMQYMLAIEWCKKRSVFNSFDSKLKKRTDFYNNAEIVSREIRIHRFFHGFTVKFHYLIHRIISSNFFSRRNIISAAFCILVIILANCLVINFVNSEKAVYFWDTSAYWSNSINLVDILKNNGLHYFMDVVHNSLATDYNFLPLLPIVPFLLIFGTSRLVFILSIFNVFIIPFAFILTYTFDIILEKISKKSLAPFLRPAIFTVALFLPVVLAPVFDGRPDAIILVIMSGIMLLLVKTELRKKRDYIILSLLTVLLVVMRRYCCFWALSLYVSIFILQSFFIIKRFKLSLNSLKQVFFVGMKLFLSGLLMLFILFVSFYDLFWRYLTENYSDMYSAYMLGDFKDQIVLFIENFGIIILGIVILGNIVSIKKYRGTILMRLNLFLCLQTIITFVSFATVQTIGTHHFYLFALSVVVSIVTLLVWVLELESKKQKILLPLILFTIVGISLYSFTGERVDKNNEGNSLIFGSSKVFSPIVRNDLDELNNLLNYLEQNMKSGEYVYVLSSSDYFNDSILLNMRLPRNVSINVSGTKHIDKRDGFPNYFFDAQYVIVADPIQTHVNPDGQKVITVLSDKILNNEAKNLKEIKQYSIDNNITLHLYRKDSSYDKDFVKKIRMIFQEDYPDYPLLWETIETN